MTHETLPHPADVLAIDGYNPLSHTHGLGLNSNIAAIPGRPDALLRWFPHSDRGREELEDMFGDNWHDKPDGVQSALDTHLDNLHSVGIDVVDHVSWTGDNNPVLGDTPTLYSTVRRIDGPTLKSHDKEGSALPPKLMDYADAIAAQSKDEPYLHDVFLPRQYTIDKQTGRPVLHDIEPRFKGARELGITVLDGVFDRWAREAAGPSAQDKTNARLRKIGLSAMAHTTMMEL